MTVEDDPISYLHDRLHTARRHLAEAYERCDTLAREITAAEAPDGTGIRVELIGAYGAAERAVLAAEADMKDAEHAFAIASELPP